jgi:hypothetical protein
MGKGRGSMGKAWDLGNFLGGKVLITLFAATAVFATSTQVLAPSPASAERTLCAAEEERECEEGGSPAGGNGGTAASGGTAGDGAANPGGTTVTAPTTTGPSSTDEQAQADEQAAVAAAVAAYDRAHSGSPFASDDQTSQSPPNPDAVAALYRWHLVPNQNPGSLSVIDALARLSNDCDGLVALGSQRGARPVELRDLILYQNGFPVGHATNARWNDLNQRAQGGLGTVVYRLCRQWEF